MKTNTHRPFRALLTAALLTFGTSALAAPVSLPLNTSSGFNGTQWYVSNNLGNCSASSGTGFDDASISGHGDAYDDAWAITIDGLAVGSADGNADLTGPILTVGPVVRSGLNVTLQHYYSPTSALARIMVSMQNPGASATTVNVQVPVNFGSDGGTRFNATSSGDTAVTTADRWVVSSDGGPSDPVNTTVFYGPGSPSVLPSSYTTSVHDCAGTEGVGATFNVTVPAGATRSVMFFAGLGGVTVADNSVASATSAAALFDANATLAPDWLTGLSAQQQSTIVNWNFFVSCAAEGYTGSKLTLCRQVCEIEQTPTRLTSLIKLYRTAYREDPPCSL